MNSKRIEWTQSGNAVAVEVTASTFFAYVNGKAAGQAGMILPPPASQRAMFAQRGAVGMIGKVIIYKERAAELLAAREEVKAMPKAIDPLDTLRSLERAVFAAEEAVRAHHENPAIAYNQRHEAKAALDAWIERNRDLYDAEQARREAAEQARRDSIRLDYGL